MTLKTLTLIVASKPPVTNKLPSNENRVSDTLYIEIIIYYLASLLKGKLIIRVIMSDELYDVPGD